MMIMIMTCMIDDAFLIIDMQCMVEVLLLLL